MDSNSPSLVKTIRLEIARSISISCIGTLSSLRFSGTTAQSASGSICSKTAWLSEDHRISPSRFRTMRVAM